jgi:hypothetical protein
MRRTSPTKELSALSHALWWQFSTGIKTWNIANYAVKLFWNDKAVQVSNYLRELGYEIKPIKKEAKP